METDYKKIGEFIGKSSADTLKKSLTILRGELSTIVCEMQSKFTDQSAQSDHNQEKVLATINDLTGRLDVLLAAHEQYKDDADSQIMARLSEIKNGNDGEPGRDGINQPLVEPVDISDDKSFPRNTLGTFANGLWISTKNAVGNPETDPLAWSCILDAMDALSVELMPDRSFKMSVRMSTGSVIEDSFNIPFPEHKGIWSDGEYVQGDIVTKAHSFWQAMEDTGKCPPGNGWKQILTAPKGAKGEAGKSIEGPQGKPGRNAREVDINELACLVADVLREGDIN